MLVLGIESSCDETGVALYQRPAGGVAFREGLLAHALHSQVGMHARYGGVVPELASRDHVRRIIPLIGEVLRKADRSLTDIGAVAYTEGPGLAGALLVGASVAKGFAYARNLITVGIHHLEGHLLSPLLSNDPPRFPFVALLVSGGHTQIMRVDDIGRYILLGETQDDAAGEAFDKVAQLLRLGYPGGPAVARLARAGRTGRVKLPRPMIADDSLDFSFSGLKTAALLAMRQRPAQVSVADLAAEFQEAVVDVLVTKSLAACQRFKLHSLVVAGGVGANQRLRERMTEACNGREIEVCYPELELCTDNAAMIAFAGAMRLNRPLPLGLGFSVRPRWDLVTVSTP
ncbi:MAG TPA: tRNA (adenosine(37)-N6)-threonylcarbamoyltransferase complex transferase subunit TsaD [Burkholderiales bacterium]|nr:tRNA (adenosine(37)-N6)-threonylcarbamoyltransferase complex transferase subunit TsaD [Burkholderiales bacterium]